MASLSGGAQLTYKELRVDYDSGWTFRSLKLIPIRFKAQETSEEPGVNRGKKTITLATAMEEHKVKVQEMQYEQGADVNWLQVTNHSRQDVFIQAGEIVAGGKQDRMIAETRFIAPGSTDYIHVFCVEKRRWSEKAKPFSYAGIANTKVRKAMDMKARQADVWKEIDNEFAAEKKKSETWSYLDLYKDASDADTAFLSYFLRKYAECERNLAGFVFVGPTGVASVEIFATPDLLDITFENMLRSYIATFAAINSPARGDQSAVKSFLDKILMNEEAQRSYVMAHGQIHTGNKKILHLVAYP